VVHHDWALECHRQAPAPEDSDMDSMVRRLSRLALLAIFCFGAALGAGANLFALIFAAEAAVVLIWAAWLAK
jgi:hypothetical protein